MGDTTKLLRQWLMLQKLCANRHGVTVAELAREFRTSDKTVRRDLQMLARIGFPLKESIGDFGRKSWSVDPDASTPPLGFTYTEVISLWLGRQFLAALDGTYFGEGAQSAFHKIRASLTAEQVRYLEKFGAAFHQTQAPSSRYADKAELIDALQIAIEERKVALLVYQSERATEPGTREVHPYGFVYHRGAMYLKALSTEHGKLRTYKLDRVSGVDVTPLQFVAPAEFDMAEHLHGSFGVFRTDASKTIPVKVRFSRSVARFVKEKTWHPSQELITKKDGALLATFELADLEEFQSWILSFGPNAEVLEPESLRQKIIHELRNSVAAYAANGRKNTRPRTTRSQK